MSDGRSSGATKGERARKKLVDATALLLRRQGYHGTGLSEVVSESGAPRGSLYFYFPGGKDELAVAALRAAGEDWRARVGTILAGAPDLGSALASTIELLAADLESSGWDNGCPVASVALERTSEPVRAEVVAHFELWHALSEELLGRRFGIEPELARRMTTVALASIEGAMLLARIQRSREPLLTVGATLRLLADQLVPPSSP